MRPDKTTVFDLFYNQRRFSVPLYQRPYVWTLEGQWQPLWQDIEDKALALQARTNVAPHFLGAIVTGQRPIFGNQISTWDIIDGQQRLTTLQVILAALKDVTTARELQQYGVDLARVTQNDGLMDSRDERFKVWPTNSDRDVFRAVMSAGGIAGVVAAFPGLRARQRFVPPLAEAYAFFYRSIERFIGGAPEAAAEGDEARAQALFDTFRRYLQVVNIELESGDDPQVIFESLNGRGVALLPSDLVRNLVFMRASTSAPAEVDALYDRYWRPYDEARVGAHADKPWWKEEERQGRLKRPRLDLFLFHYVQFKKQQEVHIGQLFQEFRKWWDNTGGQPASALKEMEQYAGAFKEWLVADGASRTHQFARWIKALDTSTVLPLMFLLLVSRKAQLSESERDGMLTDLESYLVRRAVCGLTIKTYNRFFMALMRKLESGACSRAALRAELMAGRGASVRWPDDEEFGKAFIHRPAYQTIKRPVVAAVLESLEIALVSRFNEDVVVRGKLSIEHVLPQDWPTYWPLKEVSDEAEERRDRSLQTFGNLTLVTPEFNSKLSNRDFSTKRREIQRSSLLRLNKYFMDPDLTAWDETAIRDRAKVLFDLARSRWPHPAPTRPLSELAVDAPPEFGVGADVDADDFVSEPLIEAQVADELLSAFARARVAQV